MPGKALFCEEAPNEKRRHDSASPSTYVREPLHQGNHRREVLIVASAEFGGIHLKGGGGRRHWHSGFGGGLKDQVEVFIHEADRELRAVLVDIRCFQFPNVRRSDNSSF